MVAVVEGRGVCWADQKEETTREEINPFFSDNVTLSPLTESNLHLDVPPSSVLCHTQIPPLPFNEPIVSSNLDETVVLHSTGLDVTFDMNLPPVEATQSIVKVNVIDVLHFLLLYVTKVFLV